MSPNLPHIVAAVGTKVEAHDPIWLARGCCERVGSAIKDVEVDAHRPVGWAGRALGWGSRCGHRERLFRVREWLSVDIAMTLGSV
jgi:hypothetical protein